jgi:hypothetical protein
MVQVLVVLSGGCVRTVLAGSKEVEVDVLDWDEVSALYDDREDDPKAYAEYLEEFADVLEGIADPPATTEWRALKLKTEGWVARY